MKKEDFFEVFGELDANIVAGAKAPTKRQTNWKIWSSMAACFAVVAALVFGMLHGYTPANAEPTVNLKPVINFEGVVAAVDDSSITLEDGKIILITENTKFMGDPDTGNTVSEEILVGNFIQGYTEDSADAVQITAGKIWTNESRTASGEKG